MKEFNKERALDKCKNCDSDIKELETQNDILRILYGLPKREVIVILSRIVERLSLDEIGRKYNVTRERIRQIEVKALKKVKIRGKAYGINVEYEVLKDAVLNNLSSIPFLKTKEIYVLDEDKFKTLSGYTYVANVQVKQEHVKSHDNDVVDKSIDYLELSVRSHNCLNSAGIKLIKDLVAMSEEDVLRIKNLGRKCINEVKAALRGFNLDLMDSDEDD